MYTAHCRSKLRDCESVALLVLVLYGSSLCVSHVTMSTLSFVPCSSAINPSFWHELARLKLEELKLDAGAISFVATYSHERTITDRQTGKAIGLGNIVNFESTGFTSSGGATGYVSLRRTEP